MNTLNKNNSKNESESQSLPKQNKKGKKFYIALAICLTAISAAAWSTYRSVKDFIVMPKSQSKPYSPSQTTNKAAPQSSDKKSLQDSKSNSSVNKHFIPYEKSSKNSQMNASKNKAESSEETQEVAAAKSSDSLNVYPTSNHIVKEFSDSKPVYSKTMNDWRVHNGTDFAAEPGSTVKSITDGTVADIYNDNSYGVTVKIEHNSGFTAYYSGLGETSLVKKGDIVKSGQEIGSVAKVPCEILDEPHVHIAVFKEGKLIDPLLILEKDN